MRSYYNEFKSFLGNMEGLEKFNWYVLKPIAIVLVVIAFIILQGTYMAFTINIATPTSLEEFEKLSDSYHQFNTLVDKYRKLHNQARYYKDKYMYHILVAQYSNLCEAIESALDSYIDYVDEATSLPKVLPQTVVTV